MLSNVWGSIKSAACVNRNDRAQVFRILMTIKENCYMHHRLSIGCLNWHEMDDPEFRLNIIFHTIAFLYNNNKISIKQPYDMIDVDGHKDIDPNDKSRIKITRDGK